MKTEVVEIDIKVNGQKETEKTINSFKELRKAIKDGKDQLVGLDTNSKEYAETMQKVANYTRDLTDLNNAVRNSAADLGQKLTNITKVGAGVAGGFNAIQGAMQLVNTDSEALQQTMVKLQAGIALVQGLEGVEGLTKTLPALITNFKGAGTAVNGFIVSLKTLKGALIATGIGALVVSIGLLISNWEKITKLWNDTSAEDAAKSSIDKLNESIENQSDALLIKSIPAMDNYITALNNAAGDANKVKAATDAYNKALKENNILITENLYNQSKIAVQDAEAALNKKNNEKNQKAYDEALEKSYDLGNKLAQQKKQLLVDEAKANADALVEEKKQVSERSKERKKEYDEIIKKNNDKLNNAKKIADDIHKLSIDTQEEELNELQVNYNKQKTILTSNNLSTLELDEVYAKQRAEIIKKYADKALEESKKNNAKLVEDLNKNIENIKSGSSFAEEQVNIKYDYDIPETDIKSEQLQNQIDKELELQTIRQDSYNQQMEAINNALLELDPLSEEYQKLTDDQLNMMLEFDLNQEKSAKKSIKIQQDKAKADKLLAKQVNDYKLDIANSTLNSLSSILGEETEAGKAAATASAIIDTYKAANSSYASLASIPIVGPALGAAAAAAAVVAGIANVKKIWEVNTKNGSNPSNSNSNYSAPSLSSINIPNIAQTSNLMTDQETEELNKNTRVYVLESDISSAQKKVKVVENESTF